MLTIQVNNADVKTVEGLVGDILFEKLAKSFIESGAVQCGFCTPGILLTAYAGIKQGRIRSAENVKEYIGNLCRCTGYVKIIEAIARVTQEAHE
jgi:carbon-monoxide dehydrogenase small subunit